MAGTLEYVKGDLFDTTHEVIAHGVNCRGKFASGVAGQVRKRHPEVYRCYMRKHGKEGWAPGDLQVVMTGDHNRYVANLATQEDYGRDGRQYVDYEALKKAFGTLFDLAVKQRWRVAMPKVGCGLGGGEWARVESILLELLETRDVEVEVHEP